ncbi:MAG: cyclic nucleotide-binding domain-containing protein [Alphaproteobacteria bacterium]|nr:cyclic nucleotide-binding domain-containing protein [Alphaproteobacteria bacterium]
MPNDDFTIGFNGPPVHVHGHEGHYEPEHLAWYRLFDKGEALFREGERGAEAFIIKAGKVHITRAGEGPRHDLGDAGPGEIIGELAVISDMERVATAIAQEQTVCVALSRLAVRRMMESVDMETRVIIEFLVTYIRDKAEGQEVDEDQARRSRGILDYLLHSPETKEKLFRQEPFFVLLCKSLLERAKKA